MSSSAVTTVISASASYNLTDLATAKAELSITGTSDDAWLVRAVSQVSRSIATYAKRIFVPEVLQDLFDLSRLATSGAVRELQLSRWPAIAIVSVVQTLATGATQTLTEGTDFRVDADRGWLTRLVGGLSATWEREQTTIVYMAGFGTQVTETHSVPATPYQATVSQSAAFSCDQSIKYANGAMLSRVASAPAAGQYSVAAGVYTFAAADTGQSLTFVYGVKAVPDDLVEICLRLITARYRSKDRDPALVQQETPGIGVQRFWFGAAPGQKGPFPPDITAALEPYCLPVAA